MELNIKNLSSRELSFAKYKVEARFMKAYHALKNAGRGHETLTELLTKTDPISVEYAQAEQEVQNIMDERNRRMDHHGNLRPIKEKISA